MDKISHSTKLVSECIAVPMRRGCCGGVPLDSFRKRSRVINSVASLPTDELDENVLNSLVRFDEALRAGEELTSPASIALSHTQLTEVMLAHRCLRELEAALPRSAMRREQADVGLPQKLGRFEARMAKYAHYSFGKIAVARYYVVPFGGSHLAIQS